MEKVNSSKFKVYKFGKDILISAVPFIGMEEAGFPKRTWRHVDIATTEQIRIGKIKKLRSEDYEPSSITVTPYHCIHNMVYMDHLRKRKAEELLKAKSVSL